MPGNASVSFLGAPIDGSCCRASTRSIWRPICCRLARVLNFPAPLAAAVEGRVPMPQDAVRFEELRGRLFGLAYRMLGTRADAEDVVQETACRQIVRRARQRVRSETPDFTPHTPTKRVFLLSSKGRWKRETSKRCWRCLRPTLRESRRRRAGSYVAARPVVGADRIVKLVIGLQERLYRRRTTLHLALVNGEPGLCARIAREALGSWPWSATDTTFRGFTASSTRRSSPTLKHVH